MTCATTCLTCKHWRPKAVPEMTRHGFAPCALGSASQFQSLQHVCKKHAPADAQIAAARIQWAESWRSRHDSGG